VRPIPAGDKPPPYVRRRRSRRSATGDVSEPGHVRTYRNPDTSGLRAGACPPPGSDAARRGDAQNSMLTPALTCVGSTTGEKTTCFFAFFFREVTPSGCFSVFAGFEAT
jgi:hypothetical protein